MSEASRAKRQRLLNRLEELAAKYGPPPEVTYTDDDQAPRDPSWGPLGSLAKKQLLGPEEYTRILEMDAEMGLRHAAQPAETAQPADLPATEVHEV